MRRAGMACGALGVAAAAGMARGQPEIIANWSGPNGGLYSTPGNWDIGAVPINLTPFPTFDVRITGFGDPCLFDLAKVMGQPRRVNRLTLADRTLRLNPGTSLLVVNHAAICGTIHAAGGMFMAAGAIDCGRGRFIADNGGVVQVDAPLYVTTGLPGTTIVASSGAGSLVDLSLTDTLRANWGQCCNQFAQTISASDGGAIDFSGLTSVIGGGDDDRLDIVLNSGGTIDLSSLRTIARGSNDGRTHFVLGGGTSLELPAVESMQNTTFDIREGSRLTASGPAPAAFSTDPLWGATLMSVRNPGSLLDLSAVTALSARWGRCCNQFAQTISVSDGGAIDFSGLTSVIGGGDDDRLDIVLNSGGTIDLSSLRTIARGSNDGRTHFVLAGGTSAELPAIESMQNTTFDISGGSRVTAGGPLPATYNTDALWGAGIMNVRGAESVLDLSAVESLSARWGRCCNQFAQTISASDAGAIDLSGVTSITGGGDDDRLDIILNSGGTIDLSSLRTIARGSNDGRTHFVLGGGTSLELPAVESMQNTTFDIREGSRLTASGPAPAAYNTDPLWGATLMSVRDPGSLLDLSAVTALSARWGRCCNQFAQVISASDGGRIDLSGVTVLTGASDDDRLDILATTGGIVDFGGLIQLAHGGGSGRITFTASDSGTMRLGAEVVQARVSITASGAGSSLVLAGSCNLPSSTVLRAGPGTHVEFHRNFAWSHVDEAVMDLAAATIAFNGSSPQTCEIGGLDFSVNGPCFLGNSNFGFGRLELGDGGTPSHVTLADAIDNGNRAGGRECLYLWGNFDRATCAEVGPRIDGLAIRGGATLDLARYNVYAWQGGAWTHLNALFNPCEPSIPFDGGSLAREVCYPDFDQSTGAFVLDIFDFLAFQNAFASLSPCACDCDTSTGPGVCDIFDFLCFQNAFDLGCP